MENFEYIEEDRENQQVDVELEDFLRNAFNREFDDVEIPHVNLQLPNSDFLEFDHENQQDNAELEQFLSDAFEREFGNDNISNIPPVELRVSNSAFGRRIREFDLVNSVFKDIELFLISAFNLYETEITKAVTEFGMIKTLSYFIAEFERAFVSDDHSVDTLFEKRMIYIPTNVKEIKQTTNVSEHFQIDIVNYVKKKVEEVMIEGSGFTLSRIDRLTVQIFKYEPLRGSGDISLPKSIANKTSIVNLKNTNHECFKWSILAALHHNEVKNKNKVNDAQSYRLWANELNFDDIDFPVPLNQIDKFMEQNEGIAVNVYYFDVEKKKVCPLFLALKPVEYRYVHLLLLMEPTVMQNKEVDKVNVHLHYCLIKNLSAFVHDQTTKNTRKITICDRCLNHFSSQEKLEKHKKICVSMNECCAIEMPIPGDNFESFKNYKNEIEIPFIIYADTECLLKKPETSIFNIDCSTHAYHQHEVYSIGYYFKSVNEQLKSRYASRRGVDCLDWFMTELTEIAIEAFYFLENKKPMLALSKEENKAFFQTTYCHICKKSFLADGSDIRVRDHCHITGLYRGAAHRSCNLEYQISRSIPVVMHNLSGYDSHLLIRRLGNDKKIPGGITIIPHNSENYISFIKTMQNVGSPKHFKKYAHEIKFKFIDSLRFMSASLDYLASILPHEKKHILKSECMKSGFCSNEMFNLLIRKGVFPYEYIDCYEKLEESVLPSKERFYSILSQSDISDEDYKHAQNVWEKFGIQTLGEYSDLYLKTDVLLLADVFENFRDTCHTTYSLDPAHYFSAPGLSFDAMLKYTGVAIELLTDVDMLMFVERGIRGGVSQVNKRYARANNTYMGKEFDASKEFSYLMYLDGEYICLFVSFSFFTV